MLDRIPWFGIKSMVDKALKTRKERLEEGYNMAVEMRPEFADALRSAVSFSCKSSINLFIQ